jgi:hypothetical protein
MNVRVEYESTPIRHIAVQCPHCNKWFDGRDIFNGDWLKGLRYSYEINWATFTCPLCETEFGGLQHNDKPNIVETSYPEVYKDCLQRKEVWE